MDVPETVVARSFEDGSGRRGGRDAVFDYVGITAAVGGEGGGRVERELGLQDVVEVAAGGACFGGLVRAFLRFGEEEC